MAEGPALVPAGGARAQAPQQASARGPGPQDGVQRLRLRALPAAHFQDQQLLLPLLGRCVPAAVQNLVRAGGRLVEDADGCSSRWGGVESLCIAARHCAVRHAGHASTQALQLCGQAP